jgi:glycosyltransferase involved in cell wall biosynthesis
VGEHGLDLDRYVWERKQKSFKELRLTFAAPSRYVEQLAQIAKSKQNHRIVKINNGLDTDTFSPTGCDRKTILYVAMNPDLDPNKGYSDFKKAMSLVTAQLLSGYEIKVISGEVNLDVDMASLYNGAVMTVVPSKMETLSFVTMESLSCGTPVVAYNVGGIPDLVDHGVNGYLAKPYDVGDLARGIEQILSSASLQKKYGSAGRAKIVKYFDIKKIAKKYHTLYQELVQVR